MTYLRAQRAEIDAWETMLNNSGWNWSTVYRCYNESEHFQPPSPSQAANGAAFDAAFHGTDGPVRVGWQETAPLPQSGTAVVEETWANLGVQRRADPAGGAMRGFSTWPLTVDARTSTRADAATAYLWPVVGERENLMVLLNTTATRVLWREGEHDEALASGVEVITADGRVEIVRARREVILAAGALRTPALLEHSGVGDPAYVQPLSSSISPPDCLTPRPPVSSTPSRSPSKSPSPPSAPISSTRPTCRYRRHSCSTPPRPPTSMATQHT